MLIKQFFSDVRTVYTWFRKLTKYEIRRSYRVFFGKEKRGNSPLKRGELERRAGDSGFQQAEVRMLVMALIVYTAAIFMVLLYLGLTAGISIYLLLFPLLLCLLVPVLKYQMDDYFLGAWGERAVSDEMEKLGRPLWRIFHDYQIEVGERRFNIDHVIVCPKGVFCMETKTLRQITEHDELSYQGGTVFRNGKPLPRNPAAQVRDNAKKLYVRIRERIGSAGGGKKYAVPFVKTFVIFPGWDKISGGENEDDDIIVCNSGRINGYLDDKKDVLSKEVIDAICDALENKNNKGAA